MGYTVLTTMPAAGVRVRTEAGSSAETFILVAFIFQIIFTAGFLFLFGLVGVLTGSSSVGVVLDAFLLGGAVLGIFMLYVAWEWCYQRTRRGEYEGAKSVALVLGILGIFLGGVVVGVLYLVAWSKLEDALIELRNPRPMYPMMVPPGYFVPAPIFFAPSPAPGAPLATSPSVSPPPPGLTATPGACPRCGRPPVFIPQYARSYCFTCNQYV